MKICSKYATFGYIYVSQSRLDPQRVDSYCRAEPKDPARTPITTFLITELNMFCALKDA